MQRSAARPLLTVMSLVAVSAVVLLARPMDARATGSLSSGNLTMVSTRADGTSGPALPSTFGADQEAISDDGKVIAFVSPVPADQLVTDPFQTGHVDDTNGVADVFVWDSRIPSPLGPIVTLVSWNKNHNATADGPSQHPIMAPLGLGITFESGADDLVTVPVGSFSNHLYAWVPAVSDAFPVFMVDQNYQGTAGANSVASDASIAVSLLPTPRVNVAFTSSATDLVDPNVHPANGPQEVYVRSLTLPSPSTELVSVGTDGKGTASGAQDPKIAADGIHVVFSSGGDSLVSGVTGTSGNIFERNLLTDSTTLISQANASSQGTSGNGNPVVSADGTAVAWDGNDPNLSAIPFSGNNHIFYRRGGNVQMVDTDFAGLIGCNSASNNPGLSLDGTAVVFESTCSDIVGPSITDDSGTDVFTRRMSTTQNVPELSARLVSINDAGTASGNADSFICPGNNPPHCGASSDASLAINFDGTAITFFSESSDIGTPPGGVPPFSDGNVFVRYPDYPNGGGSFGKTINLTVNTTATNPDGVSRDAVISADGASVAFVSLADDFGVTDTNDATDVFESNLHNKFVLEPTAAVHEGDGSVTITVDRIGNNGTTDKVELKTGDGSVPTLPLLPPEITNPGNSNALQPGDYTETDKTLSFQPGDVSHTFTVPIADDSVHEDPEVFNVSMSNVSGAGASLLPGPLSQSYVVILDDDADTTDPDVTIDQAAGQADPTSNSPIEFTATFSEPVTGLGDGDIDLSSSTAGGSLTATVTGGPTVYTIDVIGMTTSGNVIASIPTGAAMDAAANPSTASTSTDHTVAWISTADTTDPDVTIDQAAGQTDPTSNSPIEFTATFSEPVTGLGDGDIDLSSSTVGGSLTATVTGGPTVYTIDVIGMTTSGNVIASIPTGAAMDAAANPSTASTSTDHTVAWISTADTTDPDVTINQAAGQTDPTSNAPIEFTATFSEPVTGLGDGDIDLSSSTVGGSLTATVTGGPTVYTVDVIGMTTSGNVTASIPTGAAMDAAANPSTASTSTDHTVAWISTADTTDPDVTINQAAGQTDPTSNSPIEFTATFSEPVTGLGDGDISFTGSTVGGAPSATVTGGPTVYTIDVIGMTTSGNVIASIPTGAAMDAAANPSTASTSTDHTVAWISTADTTDPDVTIDQAAGQTDPTSNSPIEFTATFSEPVTGFGDADVSFTGSTVGGAPSATVTGGPTVYTIDVIGMTTSGNVIASIPTGAAMDAAANPSTASTSTDHTVAWISTADTTDPDVTINQAAGQTDPTSNAPIEFTATFSEPVTGLGDGDIDLSSSTVGGSLTATVTGGPTVYTVDVIGMTTSGNVTASIPTGAAMDAAANPSTASTSTDHTVAWVQPVLVASHVALALTPPASVYGQDVHATATVTVDSGTPAGSVQFAVDGTDVGSPVAVSGATATSPVLTGPASAVLATGGHNVSATFTPSDPLTYAGSSNSTSLVISKASTTTALKVQPSSLVAHIAVVAPGAGTPGGTVTFSVDGTSVGTAPVSGGSAELAYTTPAGKTRNVAAAYSGDANFAASSDSTARHDPTITAHVTSAHAKTGYGWYRAAVTITFTCTTHGAPLVSSCPSAVTRSSNGAAQSVARTISATDGGMDTVTVTFNIDHVAPAVHVTGVHNGGRYGQPAPKIHCVGSDALSGLASCTITKHTHHGAHSNTIRYRATATDKAGNTHTVKGKFTTAAIAIAGASFTKGAYNLELGHTYQFVVHSTKRPTYYDAAPAPTTPFKLDQNFQAAGHHRWVLDVTITHSLHHHKYWNLGVKIGQTMHVLRIRVS